MVGKFPCCETIQRQVQDSRLSSQPQDGARWESEFREFCAANSKYLFCSTSLNLSLTQKESFSLGHGLLGPLVGSSWQSCVEGL